jgi:hypothetical protein
VQVHNAIEEDLQRAGSNFLDFVVSEPSTEHVSRDRLFPAFGEQLPIENVFGKNRRLGNHNLPLR